MDFVQLLRIESDPKMRLVTGLTANMTFSFAAVRRRFDNI